MTPPSSKPRFPVNPLAIILCLCAPLLHAQEPGTPSKWPTSFKPRRPATIRLIQQGGNGQNFSYHTQHFELRSPTALSQHNISHFATTAESVPSVLARLPLPLLGMPQGERSKVLIYPDEASFVQAGGASGAAGYYSGRQQAIMLRADTFLIPPPRAGSKLPPKADYDLLVHEFTHLCMHRDLAYLPVWFTEGTAEYIAATHANKGVYQFSNINSIIRRHIQRNLPLDQDHITLPGIAETIALNHKTWRTRIEHAPAEDSYRSYATSLLIVHTLFHGGPKRREATRLFLNNIRKRQPPTQQTQILIPTADREKLQNMIISYWKPRGLRIKFLPAPDTP